MHTHYIDSWHKVTSQQSLAIIIKERGKKGRTLISLQQGRRSEKTRRKYVDLELLREGPGREGIWFIYIIVCSSSLLPTLLDLFCSDHQEHSQYLHSPTGGSASSSGNNDLENKIKGTAASVLEAFPKV